MKLKTIASAVILAAMVTPAAAWAKSDKQIWTVAGATVKLDERWRLQQEFTTRSSEKRGGLYEIEMVTMLGYKLGDITVAGGYVRNPQYAGGIDDFTVMEHRAREQVTVDNLAKIGAAKLSARLRMEQRWRENIDGTGWRMRPYVKLSIPLSKASKTSLTLSNETFFNLNTTPFQRQSGLDRMRNLIAINVPLTKALSAEVGYLNQHGFVRGGEDTSDHVASVAVSLSL